MKPKHLIIHATLDTIRIPIRLALLSVIFSILTGCVAHQRYVPNVDRWKYDNMNAKKWSRLDKLNYLVLHCEREMKELYDVILDEETKQISGKLKPLEGDALKAYQRIPEKIATLMIKRDPTEFGKKDISQVHLWLNEGYDLSKTTITFHLGDVNFIGVSKNVPPAGPFLVSMVLLAGAAGILIWFLFYFTIGGVSI